MRENVSCYIEKVADYLYYAPDFVSRSTKTSCERTEIMKKSVDYLDLTGQKTISI